MKKYTLIFLLLISGCYRCDLPRSGVDPDSYIGGVEGIYAQILDDNTIFLSNHGEYNFSDEVVITSDGQEEIISLDLDNVHGELNWFYDECGRISYNWTVFPGSNTTVEFSASGNLQMSYPYKTYSKFRICIENYVGQEENLCVENEVVQEYYNSGAPVHVVDIEQYPIDKQITGFSFKINNVGSGRLKQDRIWIDINVSHQEGTKCYGSLQGETTGFVNLSEKITCTHPKIGTSDYQHEVSIVMEYDYVEIVYE